MIRRLPVALGRWCAARVRQAALGDLTGGVSAALVLIPQALAYATLAGMPADRGLRVAVLAPIAAACFVSSPYLSTGPTAITSLLTLGALSALAVPGSAEFVALGALLGLLVGVVRIGMGLLRLGVLSYLVSRPVLTGFASGAAVVIAASQVPAVLGVPSRGGNPFLAAADAIRQVQSWRAASIVVAAVAAAVIVLSPRIHRLFPGVLLAMFVGLAWSWIFGYGGAVVGEVTGGMPSLTLDLPWASVPQLLAPALVIAVAGFAEPAAIARHYATLERAKWNPDRELVSQGFANLASGLGGGFPAGGSFSRTVIVREAGGKTRLAGAVTGVVVLALIPFLSILADLPTAVLAAIVIMAVRNLISPRPFLEYRRYTRLQFRLATVTFALTIALAPHVEWAVIAGVVLAVGAHLWRELRIAVNTWTIDRTLHLAPKGVLYFASAPFLEERLGRLLGENPAVETVVVHLDGLGRIDVSGALGLREMLDQAQAAGLQTRVEDIPPQATKIVRRVLNGQHGTHRWPPAPSG